LDTLHVAVCEDVPASREYIVRCLQKGFAKQEQAAGIDAWEDGCTLLSAIEKGEKYDVLFLDIEMPGLNGIELSQRLREKGNDVLIVFISNKEELVFQSFEVRPFRFIRKNHFKEEFAPLLRDVLRELQNRRGTLITVEEEKSPNIYTFAVNDIHYIEVIGKYCRVVSSTGTIELRQTLTSFEEKLNGMGYLQPHRSYLINSRFIFSIGKSSVLLDDKTELPLSRGRVDEIKRQYLLLSSGGDV